MANVERNALAELAERLDKGRWNLDVNDYEKAVRIIAELAKVEYYECLDGVIRANEEQTNVAFRNFRAIAEE